MRTPKISIPEEFQSKLRFVEAKDNRTDAEILNSLASRAPITSEKNVWTYWHSGVGDMPRWTQQNVINWVRLLGPGWTVRVLDKIPSSPNNALSWIRHDNLPDCFVNDTMTGPYVGPHSADFLRGAALYAYGGVWMDVGCLLVRHLDKICWDQLADENDPHTISTPWMFEQHPANHFVAARKGDEFIRRWHALFLHFWEGRNDYHGIIESPLIAFTKNLKFEQAEARGFKWDFKVDELTVLGYVGQVLSWVRCSWLIEPGKNGFNGVEYSCNKILLTDSLEENWRAEKIIGYKGEDLFDILKCRRDGDSESAEYKRAYDCIWALLSDASLQKFTHGKNLTKTQAAGVFLDEAYERGENVFEGGTFGELLSYGSVHFEQSRPSVVYVEPIRPDNNQIIHKGLYEP